MEDSQEASRPRSCLRVPRTDYGLGKRIAGADWIRLPLEGPLLTLRRLLPLGGLCFVWPWEAIKMPPLPLTATLE